MEQQLLERIELQGQVNALDKELTAALLEIERLRAVLVPLAKAADLVSLPAGADPEKMLIFRRDSNIEGKTYGISVADCRRAKEALNGK